MPRSKKAAAAAVKALAEGGADAPPSTPAKPALCPIKSSYLAPTLAKHGKEVTPQAMKLLCEMMAAEARQIASMNPTATLSEMHEIMLKRHPEHTETLSALHTSLATPIARPSKEVAVLTKKRKLTSADAGRMEELIKEQELLFAAKKSATARYSVDASV
jgi:hypothetical protein